MMLPHILGKTPSQLTDIAISLGLPKYTGRQIADWLYQKHVTSWDEMSNLSKKARTLLSSQYEIGRTESHLQQVSQDGTVKYLFAGGGGFVETVMIPEGDRATLCISSQRGCKMNCLFCMTGKQGFEANLTASEIINQVLSVAEIDKLTNLVFMGMGEPMDNVDTLLQVIDCLTASDGLAMSSKRITVSTIGLLPGLQRFLDECTCHLAISLHNPIPEERLKIMPIERAMPLSEAVALLRRYDWSHQRRLTFEYIVFPGLNDTPRHLSALKRLLSPLDCHVNLIRYHRIPHIDLPSSDLARMKWLRDSLNEASIPTTIRTSRGEDISAACGMLSTQEQEHKSRSPHNDTISPSGK